MTKSYLLVILGLTFVLRCPFFFASSIDWDESTFILMGQNVLDGHLPYTDLWDIKPPLLFYIFAAIIAISNKSLIIIRLIGSIFVGLSAFFVFQAGKYLGTVSTGLIASILFIIMTGELGGKVVLSEIIAALPLTLAFWVMISQKESPKFSFLVGFLLSIATLIRFNLAYLAIVIYLYYLFYSSNRIRYSVCFLIGLIFWFIIIIVPYMVSNNLAILYQSVIEASLKYSTSQELSQKEVIVNFITEVFLKGNLGLFLLGIGFLLGLVIVIYQILFSSDQRRSLILLLLWFITITFSIASSRHTYPHYLIQILPFMAIIKAIFLTSHLVDRFKYILLSVFCIGLLYSTQSIFDAYLHIFSNLQKGIDLQSDQGYQAANFLKKANPDKEAIYMMNFNIVYWLTGTKPITKMVTHPSNIGVEGLLKAVLGKDATAESEMRKILNKQPLFIVKTKEISYLDSHPEAKNLLLMTLEKKYKLVTRIETLYIYKKIDEVK